MGESTDPVASTPIRTVTDPARPDAPRLPRGKLVAALGFVVVLLAGLVIAGYETNRPVDPLDAAERFRIGFDEGSFAEVAESMSANPTVLTWPAGPPWGGPMRWTLELITNGDGPVIDHVAHLNDCIAFHQALNGQTALGRCDVTDPRRGTHSALYDAWVTCEFASSNDLLVALSPEVPSSIGIIRFGVDNNKVWAVILESWLAPVYSPVDFLLWIRDERSDVFAEVLADRLTVPNYGADSANRLLTMAEVYASDR